MARKHSREKDTSNIYPSTAGRREPSKYNPDCERVLQLAIESSAGEKLVSLRLYREHSKIRHLCCDGEDERLLERLRKEWNGLSEKPCFQRAWIVQELSGGKDRTMILCGDDSVEWARVRTLGLRLAAVIMSPISQAYSDIIDDHLLELDNLIRSNNRRLTTYLAGMRHMKCQDVRDRVFSVVSLVDASAPDSKPLFPDYSMTRWQLALELMRRLAELHIEHVDDIVVALELWEEPTQVSEYLRSDGLAFRSALSSPDVFQGWSSWVDGVFLIDRDHKGRFQVLSRLPPTEIEAWRWLLKYDGLEAHGMVPLYLGETLMGLGSGNLRRGDTLIISYGLELIVRARSDASAFTIVGGAWVSREFMHRRDEMKDPDVCKCWQGPYQNRPAQRVKIQLEASRREVLADRIAHKAGYLGLFLTKYAIGTRRAGSYIKDITTVDWPKHHVIGPAKPLCSAHRSSELHRIQGNAMWYLINSGGVPLVRMYEPRQANDLMIFT